MTEYQRKQVRAGIADCDRLIDKESNRNPDLRPANVQQMLDHAVAHKAKLIAMLENDVEIPSPFVEGVK